MGTCNRRSCLQTASLGLLFLVRPLLGQENLNPTLKDTLEKGLKCRRALEFDYVAQVVLLVDQGQLPRVVVLSAFSWARKQRDDIPFPYFQSALRELAKKYGVSI